MFDDGCQRLPLVLHRQPRGRLTARRDPPVGECAEGCNPTLLGRCSLPAPPGHRPSIQVCVQPYTRQRGTRADSWMAAPSAAASSTSAARLRRSRSWALRGESSGRSVVFSMIARIERTARLRSCADGIVTMIARRPSRDVYVEPSVKSAPLPRSGLLRSGTSAGQSSYSGLSTGTIPSTPSRRAALSRASAACPSFVTTNR